MTDHSADHQSVMHCPGHGNHFSLEFKVPWYRLEKKMVGETEDGREAVVWKQHSEACILIQSIQTL